MTDVLSMCAGLLLKSALALLIANEIRGFVLAAPVLYSMWQSGGSLMALWIGFCSLAGIALSVVVPLFAAKKLNLLQLHI